MPSDKAALRIIDMGLATGDATYPPDKFIRQVRLLDCIRDVVVEAHGAAHWAMIYDTADRLRRQRAARIQGGDGEPSNAL